MKKEGTSEMWWIIMTAILVVIVLILLLIWFKGGAGKLFGNLETQTDNLADCDKDNVADLFDKCKCDPSIGDSFPEGITKCSTLCDNYVCVK